MKISEEAVNYEPGALANISDLQVVRTDAEIKTETFKEGTDEEFRVKVITVDGIKYRVPNIVLGNLKAILAEKPDLKSFKVRKDGAGMNTRYTVIPL